MLGDLLQPTERIKKRILSNRNKSKEVKVTKPIKQYQLELEAEINELRFADGKKKL